MNPIYVTYGSGATGPQTPIIVDQAVAPFALSVGCYLVSGTVAYGLEFTLDDPNLQDPNDTAVRWFDDAVIQAGTTTSAFTDYIAPIRALRVDITQNSSALLELKVVQGYSIT